MSIAFHIKIDSRKHRKGHFFVFYLNYYCAPELIAQHLPKCVPYTNHPESLCILARITRLHRDSVNGHIFFNYF